MPSKIAIFGTAKKLNPKADWTRKQRVLDFFRGQEFDPNQMTLRETSRSKRLGENLGETFGGRISILTGACRGIPQVVATEARKYGVHVVGYSGATTIEEHKANPNYAPAESFDQLKLLDPMEIVLNGLAERSLRMIADADALVFMRGRTGTLLEFTAAFDGCDKPMYVLSGRSLVSKVIEDLGPWSEYRIGKNRPRGILRVGNLDEIVYFINRDLGLGANPKYPRFMNDYRSDTGS